MTAQIHALDPLPANPEVLEYLAEAMDAVRDGDVEAVAIALVLRDGSIRTSWSRPPRLGLLLGSVARLQHRINEAADD